MTKEQFTYQGYMSQEAEDFFNGHMKSEERDGCAVVGHFIQLPNGKTHLPSRGDIFEKEDGAMRVIYSREWGIDERLRPNGSSFFAGDDARW
jgi:hypothetical protein